MVSTILANLEGFQERVLAGRLRNIWRPRTNFECFEIEKNGHVREAVRSFGPHFRVCGPGAKRLIALLQF